MGQNLPRFLDALDELVNANSASSQPIFLASDVTRAVMTSLGVSVAGATLSV